MRRWLVSLAMVVSVVAVATPAVADSSSSSAPTPLLSFDLSDNGGAPSVSGGVFNVKVDVLPEGTGGFVRTVAISPSDAGVPNLVCRFRAVNNSRVICGFNFTVPGNWTIKAQYAPDPTVPDPVTAVGTTVLRVGS